MPQDELQSELSDALETLTQVAAWSSGVRGPDSHCPLLTYTADPQYPPTQPTHNAHPEVDRRPEISHTRTKQRVVRMGMETHSPGK